ncbi:MAG: hypothetical protein D6751_05365, partial [Deltaproteobacteria bacterium]
EPVVPEFPGLSELGNRQAQVVELLRRAQADVEPLGDVTGLKQRLLEIQKNLEELRSKVAGMGEPEDWYVDQLLQVNNAFRGHQKGLESLQAELTGRQQVIEKWRTDIRQEAEFWLAWRAWLKDQREKIPEKTFQLVAKDLSGQDKELQKLSAALLTLQEEVVVGIKEVGGELDRFSQALDKLRKATFRKNAPSFVSPDFHRQFNVQLLQDAARGMLSALRLERDYLERNGWLLAIMALILIAGAVLIRAYRQQLLQTREWLFFLRHPWSASGFVAVIAVSPFFPAPPALLRFAFLAWGVFAAARLAGSLLENRRQVRVLYLAALLLVVTTAFRLVALPQPLYRLYIAFLALLALPLLVQQIRQSRQQRTDGGGRLFRGLLRISMLVLFASLVSQVSGYMNFSFWLLQATFETGMVVLFAHMALRIGSGGIRFLLSRLDRAQNAFLRTFGEDLAQRLERLLRLVVLCYGFLYLLPTWRIFGSIGQAWDFFSELTFTLGTADISFRMVVLALLSLYLAMQISWLLQTLAEVQVFEPRRVDRGVRDAVKKLMHYGLVLIGLLFALSSLGMSLQNFVVVLGALGVGIGFGLQDIVNNFLSGLILLFERPVKVGDFIVVNNEWGDIKKIGLRSTVVETIDHSEIIVPNSQLISEKVTNWTLSSRVARLVVPVGVAYGSDVEQVMRILTEVATGHPEAVQYPPPTVLFIAFGESSLDFEIRVFVRDITGRFRIRSDMLRQIDARFRDAGIEIPFPQRDLHLRSVDAGVFGAPGASPKGDLNPSDS